jgi:hypothetical protein
MICLEKEKLYAEAVDFINSDKINECQAFGFYKRNKMHVVGDAEKFFVW